ncbi:MAG: AbrB family transcriptional regulator [Rhodocyclaceae bacterium]|nr:AbrB family transcriptional regulator [Rhodocyclaceae bacterium]
MTITAKLFMSGRSQAIRLPAKLRLDAKEVRIERVGNALWVQPAPSPDRSLADWLKAFYETHEPLPDDFLADRNDSPPQPRDWS